jgi:hypothetical protein
MVMVTSGGNTSGAPVEAAGATEPAGKVFSGVGGGPALALLSTTGADAGAPAGAGVTRGAASFADS